MILKVGVIDHDLQGHLAIWTQNSKKQHSSSLFYTNLGRPRGIAHPKRAFVSVIWTVVPVYLRELCFISCYFLLQVIVWPSWVPAFSCVKLCRTLLITTRTSRLATASPCAMRRYLGPLVTSPKPCCSMKWWTVWLGPADSWHWTLDTWNTGRSRYLLESIVYLFQIQKNYVIIITFCIVHFPFYFSSFFLFGSGMRGVGWEGWEELLFVYNSVITIDFHLAIATHLLFDITKVVHYRMQWHTCHWQYSDLCVRCVRDSTIGIINLVISSLWAWTIWQNRYKSTLVQVIVCCLMAPDHYLSQCWFIVN